MIALLLMACQQEYAVTARPPNVDPGDITDCGFTQVGNTDFYAYDCNPVFTTTDEAWAPTIGSTAFAVTEVLGHPFYQMWYQGVPNDDSFGDYGLGYAASPDGTNWTSNPNNPLLKESAPKAFDYSAMDGMQVVWDPTSEQYVMLYQGINIDENLWALGVATSNDGQDWTRLPSNPVLDLLEPSGNVKGYCWPLGLTLGDVAGFTGYIAGYDKPNGACQVYRINASNVSKWTPDDRPVLEAGRTGAWDDQGTLGLAIASLDQQKYMFYVGFGDWIDHAGYRSTTNSFLGWATWDGSQWIRAKDPLPLNTTPEGAVGAIAAVTVGSRIHLWITDDYDGAQGVGYFLYDPHHKETAE